MSLLRVDRIQNRFLNSGPIIVGLTTVDGNLICSGITSITDGLVVSAATTTQTLRVNSTSRFVGNVTIKPGNLTVSNGNVTVSSGSYFGDGETLSGIVTTIVAGTGIQISPSDGKGRVTITAPSVEASGYANTAGMSTNIQGGSAGEIPYQTGVDQTDFVGIGTTGFVLTANYEGSPSWKQFTIVKAGYADSSGISSNIQGGNAGEIVFQSSTDETGFAGPGIAGQVLISQGNLGPTFTGATNLAVGYAETAGIATNVGGGGVVDATSLNITGLSTLGVTRISDLTVTGGADISPGVGLSVGAGLTVVGFATFSNDVFISGALTATSIDVTEGDLSVGILSVGTQAFFTGIATFGPQTPVDIQNNLDVSGSTRLGFTTVTDLFVSGFSTFVKGIDARANLSVDGNANVGGTLGVAKTSIFSEDVGIGTTNPTGAADPNNTTVLNAGIVTAVKYYGDGSGLTNLDGVDIPNVLFVNKGGNDSNSGASSGEAKLTIKAALEVAKPGTTIRVAAGQYVEDNPLIMPRETTIEGDSLREVSIRPQTTNNDLIYVANACYVSDVSFEGVLEPDKAVISFNPDAPDFITRGPYIRNCTNFVRDSIGMRIDGAHALGDTKAMNVDSFTQYNQGGIGVSISNDGYAQLVSIFTICTDQSIVCNSGGQCDLTNSNSSFGRLGLVADGIGARNWTGIITSPVTPDTFEFVVDLSTPTFSVADAVYQNATGLCTITTFMPHGFTNGQSINLSGLGFTCPPETNTFVNGSGIANGFTRTGVTNRYTAATGTTYNPLTGILTMEIGANSLTAHTDFTAGAGTTYDPVTGILTIVTTTPHGMTTGDYVNIATDSLTFTCAKDSNSTNHTYPRSTDPVNNLWEQVIVVNATTFTMDVGISPDSSAHTFVSAVANGVRVADSLVSLVDGAVTFTCGLDGNATNHSYPRPTDLASGKLFGLESVAGTTISINVGASPDTSAHTFVSGVTNGVIERSKPGNFAAQTGTTYDDTTGDLVVDCGTSSGLSAAVQLTAGAGTTYDPVTGLLSVTTTAAHGLTTGDLVKIKQGSLTFTCAQDGNASNHTYPRVTDPVFNLWKQVIVVDADTFTIDVGATSTGNYTHTFVSATSNGILKANSIITIVDGAVSFTCTRDNNTVAKAYPRNSDPQANLMIGVEGVAGDTFTLNVNPGNLASFPDNYGNIFTVNEVVGPGLTSFSAYVGVSTLESGYVDGGATSTYISRPYDGQVVYLDELYFTVNDIDITDGGSGYLSPPKVTIGAPSEPWGISATAVANIKDGSVIGIDMVSNGRGYTSTPSVTFTGGGGSSATGTATTLPTYYVVARATEISAGISTVTVTEAIPYAVGVGSTVPFYRQSRSLTSSHAFEYIGSGNTIGLAIPSRGGVVIPENEIVNLNGGLVVFTSTDQAGNFRIGEGVTINQQDGSITGEAYTRSLFANVTPIILALGGGTE